MMVVVALHTYPSRSWIVCKLKTARVLRFVLSAVCSATGGPAADHGRVLVILFVAEGGLLENARYARTHYSDYRQLRWSYF